MIFIDSLLPSRLRRATFLVRGRLGSACNSVCTPVGTGLAPVRKKFHISHIDGQPQGRCPLRRQKIHIKTAVILHKRVSENSLLQFCKKFPSNCINRAVLCLFACCNLLFLENVINFSCKKCLDVIKYLTYSCRNLQFYFSKLANSISGVFLC